MVIEIIPKKVEARPLSLLNVLFYFSLILLVISIFTSLGLFLFQKNSFKTLQNITAEIDEKGTPEERVAEEKVLLYQKKINDFSNLLNLHQSNLEFFASLENLTHPRVFFSKADLKIGEGRISLSGTAENFEVLGQQFLIFTKENFVKNVNLLQVSIGKEGRIEFVLELSFDPEEFKY